MQCTHCDHPDYILFGKNRGAQRYRCQACRRTFQTMRTGKDPTIKKTGSKAIPWRTGTQSRWQNPWSASQNGFPLACPVRRAATSLTRRPVPWLKSMNSAALTIDSTVGKVLGFVCSSRSIRAARKRSSNWGTCLPWVMAQILLKLMNIWSPQLCITKSRHSLLRSNHSIVDLDTTWPDCTAGHCATVNPREC